MLLEREVQTRYSLYELSETLWTSFVSSLYVRFGDSRALIPVSAIWLPHSTRDLTSPIKHGKVFLRVSMETESYHVEHVVFGLAGYLMMKWKGDKFR